MNFFKSLLLDEVEESSSSDLESDQNPNSESPKSNPDQESQKRSDLDDHYQEEEEEEEEETDIEENPGMGWNFGGLIKNIATKSESVLQTYKQDLSDFSSGLKIETSMLREVASRVVKELPTTFESGTSVATESLESVGQAIDDFGSSVWRGTAEIISQGKETLLSNSDFDENSSDNLQFSSNSMNVSMNSKKYNRFEAQLYAIQTDLKTYCENPEDLEDFEGWKSGFVLGEKSEEIESLLNENEVMERIYTRIVPGEVDDGTFWYRYFYRVYKLKQIEDARANLVKRAIEGDEEEDLSWDVDDDDEEVEEGIKLPVVNEELTENVIDGSSAGHDVESSAEVAENKSLVVESTSDSVSDEKRVVIEGSSELNNDDLVEKVNEKLVIQGKSDTGGESGKDSDFSVVSSQPSLPDEEEDLSWDEIEDVGDSNVKKLSADGRASLAKRLTVADDDEDLSWDIEDDDDETVKS
ncbi:hypothetical protein C5167_012166 [Papaver somniferum]|uniref:BSD domain-containing protein n=1 Tax=Papaver somniferum TaxID=3469 RepID=A0A4Y7IZU6_PAPSO|nr:BSD domain-containing protein 1-like isoform X3 [Papaver somniferum]RZC53320.1 hypothetical protein C5167_012166 [Papaver somniferum]